MNVYFSSFGQVFSVNVLVELLCLCDQLQQADPQHNVKHILEHRYTRKHGKETAQNFTEEHL